MNVTTRFLYVDYVLMCVMNNPGKTFYMYNTKLSRNNGETFRMLSGYNKKRFTFSM